MWNAHAKMGKPAPVYAALAVIAAAMLITMAGGGDCKGRLCKRSP